MARYKARNKNHIPPTDISRVYRDLLIKVYGCGINQLAGIPFLSNLLGPVLLAKVLDKGFHSGLDRCQIKLRRGITITIYAR